MEDKEKEYSTASPAEFEREIDKRPLNVPTAGGVLLMRKDEAPLAGTGMAAPTVAKPGPVAVARVTVHAEFDVLVITSVTADDDPIGVTGNEIVSPLVIATEETPAD